MKVGDYLRDNDPRMKRRGILTIVEMRPYGVLAENINGRKFSILTRRVYSDGKPRRNGFDLIPA